MVKIHSGKVVTGDRGIFDAQVSIGSTDDGTFYRTAILCQDDRTESFDIISAEGVHLGRINVHGYGSHPSIEVIPNQEGRIEVKHLGRSLARIDPMPTPSETTTMLVFPKSQQKA